jgi:phytoene/squalene synthetase
MARSRSPKRDAATRRNAHEPVYLARERLLAAGVAPETIGGGAQAIAADPALPGACMATVAQARRHFAAAEVILARNPGPAGRAPRLMAATYLALLARLVARGWSRPRTPVRLGAMARARILVRHGFGLG